MPTNLVSSVTKVLTPELLARIASGLGLDRAIVEKASTASVPALLAALTSLVAKPGGAEKLGDAVAQQQPDILTSIANVIGGSGQKELIDTGTRTLSSLLGGSTVSALTSAVSKFAGLGEGGSKGLMGLIGPLLMGVLGQQQRASGLDASGLAQLLQSQKDNIARALPVWFRQLSQWNRDPRSHHWPSGAARTRLRRIAIEQQDHAVLALTGSWDFSNRRPCLVSVLRPGHANCCHASGQG